MDVPIPRSPKIFQNKKTIYILMVYIKETSCKAVPIEITIFIALVPRAFFGWPKYAISRPSHLTPQEDFVQYLFKYVRLNSGNSWEMANFISSNSKPS